jgi:hypothetical protein
MNHERKRNARAQGSQGKERISSQSSRPSRPCVPLLVLFITACAPAPPPVAPPAPTREEWQGALARLAALRTAMGGATTRRIALELREPTTGKVLTARGAVASLPPRALRMILLGPGGTTALDLWVDRERYRFAVPAIDLKKRGDLRGPREERRGLPVDFLAFWLLRPAGGRLLWHGREPGGDRFVLADGAAVIDLHTGSEGRLSARRSSFSDPSPDGTPGALLDEETVTAEGPGCAGVRYHQKSTGLSVTVSCEGETRGEPPAAALADPDAEAR